MLSKAGNEFQRPQARELAQRLDELRRRIQIVTGARQVGKTTLVQQVTGAADVPVRFASASDGTMY